jgi:hypothetical protein
MSLELIYTSAPKGLKPGSRGFCTVAMTQGMTAQLVDRLEALSGYRQIFAPQDPQASLNPVVYSHLRISVAGRNFHVLSRVCAAGLDYSQRTNKFAHHVVLDANELPQAGPAWVLAVPGFMVTAWDQTTRLLPPRARPPAGNSAPGVCQRWQQTTGDAGWGGAIVDAAIKNPKGLVTLIFKPGQDPLPLLAESLALMPAELRWQATFSTYYTKLPPGVECRWRCVVEGSPEAKAAAGVVIELCRRLGQPPAGEYVTAARTGRVPVAALPSRRIKAESPGEYELAQLLVDPTTPAASTSIRALTDTPDWPGALQPFPPSLPPGVTANPNSKLRPRRFREKEAAKWPYVVGMLAVALLMTAVCIAAWNAFTGGTRPDSKSNVAATDQNAKQNVVQPNLLEDPTIVAEKRKADDAKQKLDDDAKNKPEAKAAEVAQDKAKKTLERDDAKKRAQEEANEKAAREKEAGFARELAIDDLNRLGDAISLPARRYSTPNSASEIGSLRIPKGMECTIKLFGGENLPKGFHLSAKQTVRDTSPRLEVSLLSDSPIISPTVVASFWAKNNKLYFDWECGPTGSPIADQILNSVLEVSVVEGGKPVISRLFSLRVPVSGSPPINLGKVLSSDLSVESPSQTLASPPSQLPELGVEFIGAPNFTPKQSTAGEADFEISRRIHLEVQPKLGSDDLVTLRVKYLGVRVSWALRKNDPLRSILRTPPDFSRIQVSSLNGIVEHLSHRSADLQKDINTTEENPRPKNEDEWKKLTNKLTQDTQESLDAVGDNERKKTLPEKLATLKQACDTYLGEAKSLQSLFEKLQGTTCGYRVYFTVHEHKVYLVTADTKSSATPDSKSVK